MAKQIKIVVWNANGLAQHRQEVELFLNTQEIDIMLVSETRFTERNYFKIPKYTTYVTNHPDGTAHGGTAVIVKSNIKHHELQPSDHDFIQATS